MNATLRLAPEPAPLGDGLHVAIIMDGNGRWATSRGWPRTAGHAEGVEAVRRVVEAAGDLGIGTLTLFAFSSDNWRRPDIEVRALMRLFRSYLTAEAAKCADNGIRISVIGRRDRLSPGLVRVIEDAEARTARADRFFLRIAVDYSARDAILRAASRLNGQGSLSREAFARLLADPPHDGRPVPDVDLLIRTGGEKRLSDFLLWECAYAELVFTDRMWPDFGGADLAEAVREFNRRERRFGTVPRPDPHPLAPSPAPSLPPSPGEGEPEKESCLHPSVSVRDSPCSSVSTPLPLAGEGLRMRLTPASTDPPRHG